MLPVPPPFTIGTGATSRTAATTAARRSAISAAERRLMKRIARPCSALAQRAVAEAGDVRLVAHQRRELEPGPARDLARRAPRLLAACGSASASRRSSPGRRAATSSGRARCRPGSARAPARGRARSGRAARPSRPSGSARRSPSTGRARRARRGRRSGRRAAGRRSRARAATATPASVKVISPRKPLRRCARIASSSARQRTDLLATRIGVPRRAPSISRRVRPHRVEVHERERRVHAREDPLELLVGRSRRALDGGHRHDPGRPYTADRSSCSCGGRLGPVRRRVRQDAVRRGRARAAPCSCASLFAALMLAALWRPRVRGLRARATGG